MLRELAGSQARPILLACQTHLTDEVTKALRGKGFCPRDRAVAQGWMLETGTDLGLNLDFAICHPWQRWADLLPLSEPQFPNPHMGLLKIYNINTCEHSGNTSSGVLLVPV